MSSVRITGYIKKTAKMIIAGPTNKNMVDFFALNAHTSRGYFVMGRRPSTEQTPAHVLPIYNIMQMQISFCSKP
jgi:hypothetical protein